MVWLLAAPDPVRAHHPESQASPLTDHAVEMPPDHSAPLAYFDTGRASNSIEAINGLIELHRRIARNRGNYRLRLLLIGGGLDQPHQK